MAAFCGTLNKELNRRNFIIVKVRRLRKKFFGRIASMHPQNYMKNWQAAPTSGTSSKEGLKSLNFLNSKYIDYIQFHSTKLFLDTRKVEKKFINLLGSSKNPLRGGWKRSIFCRIKSSSISKKVFRRNCFNARTKRYKKLTSCTRLRNIP